jgi:hypothetical protein
MIMSHPRGEVKLNLYKKLNFSPLPNEPSMDIAVVSCQVLEMKKKYLAYRLLSSLARQEFH